MRCLNISECCLIEPTEKSPQIPCMYFLRNYVVKVALHEGKILNNSKTVSQTEYPVLIIIVMIYSNDNNILPKGIGELTQ